MKSGTKWMSAAGALVVAMTSANLFLAASQARAATSAAAVNSALPSGHVNQGERQRIFFNPNSSPVVVTIEFSDNDHGSLLLRKRATPGQFTVVGQFRTATEEAAKLTATRNVIAVTVRRGDELEINLVPNTLGAGQVGASIDYQFLSIR